MRLQKTTFRHVASSPLWHLSLQPLPPQPPQLPLALRWFLAAAAGIASIASQGVVSHTIALAPHHGPETIRRRCLQKSRTSAAQKRHAVSSLQ